MVDRQVLLPVVRGNFEPEIQGPSRSTAATAVAIEPIATTTTLPGPTPGLASRPGLHPHPLQVKMAVPCTLSGGENGCPVCQFPYAIVNSCMSLSMSRMSLSIPGRWAGPVRLNSAHCVKRVMQHYYLLNF